MEYDRNRVNAFLISLGVVKATLSHHGVKGQRWGVRRTDAQLARAASRRGDSSEGSDKTSGERSRVSTNRTRYKSGPKGLSDSDLRARISRMETEKRYNDLNSRTVSEGEKIIRSILTDSGKQVATRTLTGVGMYMLKRTASAKLGEEVAKEIFGKKK